MGFLVQGPGSGATTISGDPAIDTETGRISLCGEIRALRVALMWSGPARKKALADALEMRAYRHASLPSTVVPEHQLDIMEGHAGSTGIDIGLPRSRRVAYTLHDMQLVEQAPNYARELCFAVGPAYSELLDAVKPNWRRAVRMKTSIAARAYGITVTTPSVPAAEAILARYGGAEIEREESAREALQGERDARYRARLVTGPTLSLPMKDFKIGFNTMDVDRFGRYDSVYHRLMVSAPWGQDRRLSWRRTDRARVPRPHGCSAVNACGLAVARKRLGTDSVCGNEDHSRPEDAGLLHRHVSSYRCALIVTPN